MFSSAADTMMVAQSSDQPWYWYCTTRNTPWKRGTHGSSETFTLGDHPKAAIRYHLKTGHPWVLRHIW
jgi:hypothetical protein